MSLNSQKVLIAHGLKPKKSFGQNFMMDENINHKITAQVKALSSQACPIIEFGAGTGSLTKNLLNINYPLYAIERDRDLIPILQQTFHEFLQNQKLILLEDDAKKFALNSVCSSNRQGILVGNLPYQLTSSFIIMAIHNHELIKGAVFLIQKEVGQRLNAQVNSKEYGFLTVILDLFFTIDMPFLVSKNCFWPIPKVDSCVVVFHKKASANMLTYEELVNFMEFVKIIFQKRRKKISTILHNKISIADLKNIVDPNVRPENITSDQFLKLYKKQ